MESELVTSATQTFGSTLVVLVFFIGGVLGLFGVAKLLELYVSHRIKKKETHDSVATANEGKKIDADQDSFKIVAQRLQTVEERLFKLEDLLRTQMTENAKLATENEHLSKEIETLRQENKDLRDHRRESDRLVAALQQEIALLKQRFDSSSPLPVQLVDGEST